MHEIIKRHTKAANYVTIVLCTVPIVESDNACQDLFQAYAACTFNN